MCRLTPGLEYLRDVTMLKRCVMITFAVISFTNLFSDSDPDPDSVVNVCVCVCVCVCVAMFLSDRTSTFRIKRLLSRLMTLLPVLVNSDICIIVHTQDKIVCDWGIPDSGCVRIMEIQN